MTISKWRHPIRYWRLVTTPTCETCGHYVRSVIPSKSRCACKKYLEHANRLNGTEYRVAEISLVRGTRWCDFEPIEEETDD